MLADFHVHSEFSDDCLEPMEFQIEQAVRLGFDQICFTEHVDYGQKRDWDDPKLAKKTMELFPPGATLAIHYQSNVNYDEYFMKLDRMQKNYDGIIKIYKGLEFGIQTHWIDKYNQLANKYADHLDFCFLSIHQVNDEALWSSQFMAGKTQDTYIGNYYNELLNVAKSFDNYDCIAHLDSIVRYDKNGVYPFNKIKSTIENIYTTIIQKNKALEINTSCWKYNVGDTTPSIEMIKLYKEMGGELLVLGSDAHSQKYIGYRFDEMKAILKDLGFKHFYTYSKHKPTGHNL